MPADRSPRNACESKVQYCLKSRPSPLSATSVERVPSGEVTIEVEVAGEGGGEGDPDAHALDDVVGGRGRVEGRAARAAVRNDGVGVEEVEPGRRLVEAGGGTGSGQMPALRQADRRQGVDEAVAVVVAEVLAAAVPGLGRVPAQRKNSAPPGRSPISEPTRRADAARIDWTSRQPRSSFASYISATTPLTIGAAADVPSKCRV